MSVFLGNFSPDQPRAGANATEAVATFVDVQHNLLRAKPGDVVSFYHLDTMVKQGSATVASSPILSHSSDAIAKMR